ncbi:MAG: hypothetical protein H6Q76_2774 [Firmicutes bacterium]|nr:hypothetical protein [Bacillota bacterium]
MLLFEFLCSLKYIVEIGEKLKTRCKNNCFKKPAACSLVSLTPVKSITQCWEKVGGIPVVGQGSNRINR